MTAKIFKVVYSPESIDDLRAIYLYIANELKEPETARKQIDRIRSKIRGLDSFPGKYAKVEWAPWSDMDMRRISVDNYLVFYLVNNEKSEVTIVRVFYGGRDIPSHI